MGSKSNHTLDIRFWDVEHGSAAYMRARTKDVVIDCGANDDWSPLRWINDSRFGVNNIDYLIISHPHHDHIEDLDVMKELGLAPSMLQRPKSATELVGEGLEMAQENGDTEYIEDAEYYLNRLDEYDGDPDTYPSDPSWALDEQNLSKVRADGGIPDRGVTFHTFGTSDSDLGSTRFKKLNNLSRVTVVNSFGFQYVTMGDLMPKGIEELKDNDSAMSAIADSEVLVAPHHGRDSSYDDELVEHINPDLVLVSDEGDPKNPATTDYYSHATGVPVEHEDTGNMETRYVLTTRNDGRIRIQASNPDTWVVSVFGRDYASQKADTKRYDRLV
ncbi:ComEC/Rec2 family competence protein [Halovivax cerinus]|uniref:ComEC/Rec2 family competence protein n=1 Tax=Halovivax cerinus TaxID=1487865 RepID=A0ABD5NNF7_9EURY|nr:MBL fold metallo-hydrolase [Halovivax cerinus]